MDNDEISSPRARNVIMQPPSSTITIMSRSKAHRPEPFYNIKETSLGS